MRKDGMHLNRKLRLYLGTAEFYKRVGIIAIPIALQSLISIGVNMMDTVMLGALGEVALSASSLANQFINIYHVCCMGIGMGASVMVARFWGMQDSCSLKQSITIMLRLCIVFGLLFMAATILAPGALMRIYTPDADIIREGIRYFNWSVPTYLLLGLSLTCTIVLRSVGQAKVPLICSSVSFMANLFFNWVFIFGNLGAPRMEVAGAALGTLLARIIEFSAIAIYFFLRDKNIGYRIKDLFMDCHGLVPEYLKICIPVLISDSLLALGNSAIAMIMGRIGAAFVSANSITAVTQQMTTVLTQGISRMHNHRAYPGRRKKRAGPERRVYLPDFRRIVGCGGLCGNSGYQRACNRYVPYSGGNPPDSGAADGIGCCYPDFYFGQFHTDKRSAPRRRRYEVLNVCRYSVPLAGLCSAGDSGRAGMEDACILDLFFHED